jgi:penicillin-binding protein 1A
MAQPPAPSDQNGEGESRKETQRNEAVAANAPFRATRHVLRQFGTAFRGDVSAAFRRLRRRPASRQAQASRRPSRTRVWFRALKAIFVLGIVGAGLALALIAWALHDTPWGEIADGALKPVVILEAADGAELISHGPYQGAHAVRAEFPAHLVDAVISAEDRRFYRHYGVDLKGIARAAVRNLRAQAIAEGGSTITQQLVKISYLENDRTLKRKIQEAVIAVWLEQTLGKDEILTRYLNNIYLGAGATGMPAAARVYFDKELAELLPAESAMLAGLIRAPSHFNPLRNLEGARQRAETVLATMVADGKLDATAAAEATREPAELRPFTPTGGSGTWFADWVIDDAREIAGPYRGTIKMRITLMPRLQAAAEKVIADTLQSHGEAAGATEAALVAMTPDGAVVAMVGGRDYHASQFNRAVAALRQPGSAFKLFTYYAAIKAGFWLDDEIEDAPIEIDGWNPQNFAREYAGSVSMTEAFARSLNAATVALAMEVGMENVIAAARELGIDAALEATPSLALGSYGVSLIDLTGAYASVRAGRAPVEPWGIASFHAHGQPRAFSVGPSKAPETDLAQSQEGLIHLLRAVVEHGTGQAANLDGSAAGKTGTSQNFRDAWFIGFTPHLIAGVWVGNDDETPMNEMTGGKLPAEIWRAFMVAAEPEIGSNGALARLPLPSDGPPQSEGAQPLPESLDASFITGLRLLPATPNDQTSELVEEVRGEPAPATCDVDACSRMYRSFRESDCTYQPYRGPRRFCAAVSSGELARAAPPRSASEGFTSEPASGSATTNESSLVACNYRACSRSYRSFRPSDCTYQPYNGPRRLCER